MPAGKEIGLVHLLGRLAAQLSPRRRVQLAILLALMIVSALADVISLGAVLPFIGALTAPDQVLSHPAVKSLTALLGDIDQTSFVLWATLAFCIAALFSGAIRILQIRVSTRLAYTIGADLGIHIYQRTLHQDYEVHKSLNSSEVISGVTRKVDGVVTGVIVQSLTLVSSSILFLSILTALLLIDWRTALAAFVIFGTTYLAVTLFARRRLQANGKRIAAEQTKVLKSLNEGLNSIRDVLLNHSQDYYTRVYHRSDVPMRLAQGNNLFFAQFPRYGMEALGMVLIALLAYSLVSGNGAANALPVLAAMAVGGQRMLPALQQGYAAMSTILGNRAILADTVKLLDQPLPATLLTPPDQMPFKKDIRFDAVGFTYSGSTTPVLADISFTIAKGARVGFVGTTGSGKSTAVDLLMGLLRPSSGRILVDGTALDAGNLRTWQTNIAHVPQSIYLADGSFAENIAHGEDESEMDFDRIKAAAEKAQIADFIEASENGYHTSVGENGGLLSGGQRQRIGIARALYRRANVIVFDEATSALDSTTEQAVIDAINGLDSDITVVMIAHRAATLRTCSLIIRIDKGRITQSGSYMDVLGAEEKRGRPERA